MYHPDKNPTGLPEITDVAQIDKLPWGGNAWWDIPISLHVDKFVRNEAYSVEIRRAACERAGFLMTGEDCTFESLDQFREYLRDSAQDVLHG